MLLVNSAKLKDLKNDDGQTMCGAYIRYMDTAKLFGGKVPVSYTLASSGIGRYKSSVDMNVSKGSSLFMPTFTTMKREIRALLADKEYLDIDFVNCHPSILEQTLDRNCIPCPLLTNYNGNRATHLRTIAEACGVSCDCAKELFIRILYLGTVDAWCHDSNVSPDVVVPKFVIDLAAELVLNTELLLTRPELQPFISFITGSTSLMTPRLSNHCMASISSSFLQSQERACLDALCDAIIRDGFKIGALIYDGMHISKDPRFSSSSKMFLKNWRSHVTCTTGGLDLEIKVKPFDIDMTWLVASSLPIDIWDDSWMNGTRIFSYTEMKELWEKRAFKIVVSGDFARQERKKFAVYNKAKLLDAYQHLHFAKVDEGKNSPSLTRHHFIKTWLDDCDLRGYKWFDLYPPPMECPEDTFNSWTGFDVSKFVPTLEVDTDSEAVRAFVGHIRILMNGDEASMDYILDWIAQIFQQPSKKPGIALIFKGAEGVGKNRLTDLLHLMIGESAYLETAKPESVLFGRFTDARRNKFLIVINESSAKSNYPAMDQLKDMITATSFVWEAKGRDGVVLNCFDRLLFTTNNSSCVRVNPDSRRFVIFEVSSKLKGDTTYFKRLSELMESPHGRFEFFTFLMERNLSEVDWINDRPMTQCYTRMVENNLCREFKFVRDMIILPACPALPGEKKLEMSASSLFADFCGWLYTTSNSKDYTTEINKFGSKLTSLVEGSNEMKGISKFRRGGGMIYVFDVGMFRNEMVAKMWLNDDMTHMDTSSASERRFKEELELETFDGGKHYAFKSVRPAWLVNVETNCRMELDMFDEEQKLAVEYDGPQHYEFPNDYHKSEAEFVAQQSRDRQKDAECKKRDVRLVRVRASDLKTEISSFREQVWGGKAYSIDA